MIISLVVAASDNNVIGKDNQLPWHLPNDMKFFKNTTWGLPILMGRKTFESMKSKALAGRINIIITRQSGWKADGVLVGNSIEDAMMIAKETDCKEVCVIGGGEIFKEVLPKADRLYMTRVHTTLDGDAFFPALKEGEWKLARKRDCYKDEKHAHDYTFETWERK
jgi:dihydrofolate reductase